MRGRSSIEILLPAVSYTSTGPSIRYGPFGFGRIDTSAISFPPESIDESVERIIKQQRAKGKEAKVKPNGARASLPAKRAKHARHRSPFGLMRARMPALH